MQTAAETILAPDIDGLAEYLAQDPKLGIAPVEPTYEIKVRREKLCATSSTGRVVR